MRIETRNYTLSLTISAQISMPLTWITLGSDRCVYVRRAPAVRRCGRRTGQLITRRQRRKNSEKVDWMRKRGS